MTGLHRTFLLALAAYHRWRSARDLENGKLHALRATECEAEAAKLRCDR